MSSQNSSTTSDTSTTSNTSQNFTPTLAPSICFFAIFILMSILHFVKYIRLRRTIYLYLLIFSLLRSFLFIFRIAWSPHPNSMILGMISNVLTLGAFFVILEALCRLLYDWLLLMTQEREIPSIPKYERKLILALQLISPLFSVIGAIGEIFEQQSVSRQTSSLGFLGLVIIYIMLVTYFALKYSKIAIRKQLKALVLFISAALLIIELVYRTIVSFSHETTPIYYYEWVYYIFECVPEIILLLILGEVILGEWFYSLDDDNKLKMARRVIKVGGKEGANTDSKISDTIVINVNDDSKLPPIDMKESKDTKNTLNTNAGSAV